MTTLLICVGIYLAVGVLSVWAAYKDLIADRWWAWLVVAVAWPKLFTT